MKKFLLILLLVLLLFTFFSCSKSPKPSDDGEEIEKPDTDEDTNEDEEDKSVINIGKLKYKLVYDPYELGMEDLAEDFAKEFKKKTDYDLELLEYSKAKKEKYVILIGKVKSNSNSLSEYNRLSGLTDSHSSAFSLKFSDKTLMITATSKSELQRGIDYLISQIVDGELVVDKDFSKTEFHYNDVSGEIVFSESEHKSLAMLSEITVNNVKLLDFSALTQNYEFEYPSTENYPKVTAKALNPNAIVDITNANDNDGVAKITVTAEDGFTKMSYEIHFKHKDTAEISSEIVNKDGAAGVITFVFDDGDLKSADIVISRLMKKYDSVRVSFGVICNQLATAEKNGEEILLTPLKTYYSPIANSVFSSYNYKYQFWKDAAKIDGVDVLSHSYSHTNEGVNSDPEFELLASQAILKELCEADAFCYVLPGVGTVTNENYMKLLQSGEIYIGARATSRAINLASTYNPYKVAAYAVTRHSTKLLSDGSYTTNENSTKDVCISAGIETWENHINEAIDKGGWACFCMHGVVPSGQDNTGKWGIYQEQADALFKYADKLSKNGEAWIATFTEASIYYAEWKAAKLTSTLTGEDSVSVKLACDLDSEVYNMALTVKVPVPISWTEAFNDGNELEVFENIDRTKFVYVNLAPGENATITK